MSHSEKSKLRNEYKQIRNSVTDRKFKEKLIEQKLEGFELFADADTVFAYAALGSETSVDAFAFSLVEAGRQVAFPVCNDDIGNMEFYLVKDINDFEKGMYGIREPVKEKCKKAVSSEKSVCLVPGVCFDETGGRVGYGKGYYDRFLETFKGKTVGISFQQCVIGELILDSHDKKVTYLITDKKIYNFCK